MNKNEQDQYLISKGWTKLEHKWKSDGRITYTYDIDNRFSHGGLSLDYAIKIQSQYEILDRQGICYLAIRDNLGYGWKIRYFTDRTKENWTNSVFTHLDEETAYQLVEKLNNGLEPEDFDPPSVFRREFNLLAIFEEKHRTRYFYVPTYEDLCKVALKIFKERDEEKCWYDLDGEEPIKPDIAEEEICQIKSEVLKRNIADAWKQYAAELKSYKSNLKDKQLYDKALQDKTGEIALQFLQDRESGEYESWEVIKMEEY